MAMTLKYKPIFILCMLLTVFEISSAQIYNIKSLDGHFQEVLAIKDYPHNILNIIYLKDTIKIDEFLDLREVSVLNEQFLKIVYSLRSGSDETDEDILLLCVDGNKLYQAINVTYFSGYNVEHVYNKVADSLKLFDEHGNYSLGIDLVGTEKTNYRLIVNLHDKVVSKRDSETNHDNKEQIKLNFDLNRFVFYSSYEDVSKYFTTFDPKSKQIIRKYISGVFPTIRLGKYKYYFVEDNWYGKGDDDR